MVIERLSHAVMREAVHRALSEDVGPLDLTTRAIVDPERRGRARIFSKEAGVVCGVDVAREVFHQVDAALEVRAVRVDGQLIEPGVQVLEVAGRCAAMLTAERCALNFLQHLSGIATQTRAYVERIEGTQARILDTRKTVPGLRALQKYAVVCGGGVNHRMGLYDAFMIKDNHVALMSGSGGFAEAVAAARAIDPDADLIVEADHLEQVEIFMELGVDRILLDNMTLEEMKLAVKRVAGRVRLEASGNMTLERVRDVAETGVDFISVGALTHSVRALDFSLEWME
ncbi:MAG: carboxylating nicotinate-nucleotide diphosphorylase [Candidatus Methylacidiphilales bacterium]